MMRQFRGDNNYVVAFQEPGIADAVLAENTEKAFRIFYSKGRLSAEEFAALPEDAPERRFELLEMIKEPQAEPAPGIIIAETSSIARITSSIGISIRANFSMPLPIPR